MGGEQAADSPLDEAAGAVGPETTEAFSLLANETRLAILLALWEAYEPHGDADAVGFAELRDRVGVRQGAQFNYHLDKLVGEFVAKTDEGYELRPVAIKLVQTLIAGTGHGHAESLPERELDYECSLCGAPAAITYENGWLYQVCTDCEGGIGSDQQYPDGTLFAEPFPAAALSDRSTEEIFAAAVFRLFQVTTMKLGGLCPRCSGVVESTLAVCPDHDPRVGKRCGECGNADRVRIEWTCSVCKYWGSSSPSAALIVHPSVVSFYHERGIDLGYEMNDFEWSTRALELARRHEQELVAENPPRVRVTVRYGGDELSVALDEETDVVEVERPD